MYRIEEKLLLLDWLNLDSKILSSNFQALSDDNFFYLSGQNIITMKYSVLSSFKKILFFIFIATFLISCGKSTEEMLIGTWSGTDFKFEQAEGPDLAAIAEGGKGLHIDGKLILEETGTFIITSPEDRMSGKGTWKVKKDQLIMKEENAKEEVVYDIVAISNSELITSNQVAMESPLGNISGKITLTYKK